jgi:hypothetical protein
MLFWTCLGIMLVMISASAVVGISLCNLLPYRLRPAGRFYFSPLLGLTVFIFIATIHGWLAPFKQWSCVAEGLCATGVGFYSIKNKKKLLPYLLIILPYAVVASLTVFFPLLRFDSYNSFNDIFTYLVHGQWLQEHAFSEPAIRSGYYPALTQVALYQSGGMRMGASFFLGWTQAVFGLEWSYYAYSAAVVLPLIAGSLAVGGAIKLMVLKNRWITLLMGCFTATSFNGLTFGASYGFFPQTFGLAFAAGATNLLAGLIKYNKRKYQLKKLIINCMPVALLFGALALCYNDLLLFIGAGLFLFMVITIFTNPAKLKSFMMVMSVLVFQIAILVNVEFVRVLNNFLKAVLGIGLGSQSIGWPIFWKPIEFVNLAFGLRAPVENGWLLGNEYISITVIIIIIAAVVSFVLKNVRTPAAEYIYINISVLAIFIAGFLYFRYIMLSASAAETGNTFLQFKVSKWASPFCAILLGASIVYYSNRIRHLKYIMIAILATLVFISSIGNYKLSEIYIRGFCNEIGSKQSAFDTLLKLRRLVADIDKDKVIYLNLGNVHHKLRQMVAYVLNNRKLAGDYTDDAYIMGHLPPDQRIVNFKTASYVLDFQQINNKKNANEIRTGNLILRKKADYQITLASVLGGYGRETDNYNWWYWTEDKLVFKFKILGQINKLKLKCLYMPISPNRSLKIIISGVKQQIETYLKMENGWNTFVSGPFNVDSENITVEFISLEPPRLMSNTDPRHVSFLSGNVELCEVSIH